MRGGNPVTQHGQHLVVDVSIAGNDLSAREQPFPRATKVGDSPAGLLDKQKSPCHIPGAEQWLPVPVETAPRDVSHVERRGSRSPHAL